jgi:hypothetical protein
MSRDIVLVHSEREPSLDKNRVGVTARFYGLEVDSLRIRDDKDRPRVIQSLRGKDTVAAIITASALRSLDQTSVLSALYRGDGKSVPLLILGATAETDPNLVRKWSGGAVVGCRGPVDIGPQGSYIMADSKGLTRQLAGQSIPFAARRLYSFILSGDREAEEVMKAGDGGNGLPVFVRTTLGQQEVFFLSEARSSDGLAGSGPGSLAAIFSEVAPLMMFVRYCARERAWHSVGHFANLTVDDARLTEPYGNLSFKGLLEEMKNYNFHTTVAFIPWNFDGSQPSVVSLIRNHPDRFSICIHGNNHDHQEFCEYGTSPLSAQVANIRQALARMQRFQTLTNLPYDPVMVFPHGIAPEQTLSALKQYNFLATVNSTNVPLGSKRPADPLFLLRSGVLSFANFPSVKRYSAEVPISRSEIAINAFLENPILFYVHQGFFASGIGAFDEIAQFVNDLQPDTRWEGLGYIAEHLYVVRLRDSTNCDVMSFSRRIRLDNTYQRDLVFRIEKQESRSPPIRAVKVDGRDYPYELSGNYLTLQVPVRAGGSRHIDIEYENDMDFASCDASKPSLHVWVLRKLSDLRDMTISTNRFGRSFIHLYYRIDPSEPELLLVTVGGIFALGSCCLGLALRKRIIKKAVGPGHLGVATPAAPDGEHCGSVYAVGPKGIVGQK